MTDTVDNQALSCTLVFDFDSTLIANETLDILAEIVCAGRRDAEEVAAEIARITDMGMNGEIDLRESFARRFALLKPMREHIQLLAERLPTFLAHSVVAHADFLRTHAEHIYVVTGSFRESVLPTTRILGIHDSHVFGNVLLYDESDTVIGVDPHIPTSHSGGKADIIQAIRTTTPNLLLPIVMVGDGISDANAKKPGVAADVFWAYTEVISRPTVVTQADKVAQSMTDIITLTTMI
jgi:D-3-phosphoglycerate dehydrogenase